MSDIVEFSPTDSRRAGGSRVRGTRTGSGARDRREPTYDALARGLKAGLDQIAPCVARVARRLVALRAWTPFGFARCDDFARERLDRSGRWLRDAAALGQAIEQMPQLADALLGRDGGRPVVQVAAVAVGRVASAESVDVWIALARQMPVRKLKNLARLAREAGSEWPTGSDSGQRAFSSPDDFWRSRDGEGLGRIRLGVPVPVKTAFDVSFELHRAVCGRNGGVAGFVDSLVGEAYAGPHPPCVEVGRLPMARDWAAIETLLYHNTDRWAHLDDDAVEVTWVLAEASDLMHEAGQGGPVDLCRQMQQLIALEDRLQRELGKILALIGHAGGWRKLEFLDLGHYAEQRLGLSRTTARDRARLYCALTRLPVVRRAYERGTIGFEATLVVLRVLGRGSVSRRLQHQWVDRARRSTLKRLRDEARVVKGTLREPLTDDEWFSSLRLAPGDTRDKVKDLGRQAIDAPFETLGLTLPEDLALEFLAAVKGWTAALHKGEGAEGLVASQLARSFATAGRPVPQWVGLFAMLEDFAQTWDDPKAMPKRKADRIYIRDGWRCTAPGCTSRRNLESHHVVYRSRGGDKTAGANQICACRFHHQMGEHGVLARCRGTAPLGLTWRLGREDLGTWYKNELVVVGDQSAAIQPPPSTRSPS